MEFLVICSCFFKIFFIATNKELFLSGVPQGSLLCPLLFLAYINDNVENLNCNIRLFADEASFFSILNDATQTTFMISEDLDKIEKYTW